MVWYNNYFRSALSRIQLWKPYKWYGITTNKGVSILRGIDTPLFILCFQQQNENDIQNQPSQILRQFSKGNNIESWCNRLHKKEEIVMHPRIQ